jgi:plasmid stability protein
MEELMATLNIKNLPDGLYRKLKARAKKQNRSLSQEVTRILSSAVEEQEKLSVMDLEGLGKEIWTGVDTSKYIDEMRSSWK